MFLICFCIKNSEIIFYLIYSIKYPFDITHSTFVKYIYIKFIYLRMMLFNTAGSGLRTKAHRMMTSSALEDNANCWRERMRDDKYSPVKLSINQTRKNADTPSLPLTYGCRNCLASLIANHSPNDARSIKMFDQI